MIAIVALGCVAEPDPRSHPVPPVPFPVPSAPSPVPQGPRITYGPVLRELPNVPLSREVEVRTDVATRLVARLVGDGVDVTLRFPTSATEHRVPLHGAKPDRDVDVLLTLIPAAGPSAEARLGFRTPPLPSPFPTLEVLAAGDADPGYVVLPFESKPKPAWQPAIDPRDGEVAYLYVGDVDFADVKLTPRGTFLGLTLGAAELDPAGALVRRWYHVRSPGDPSLVVVPYDSMNHELFESGAGELTTLVHRSLEVDAYPVDYEPGAALRPATIVDAGIVTFEAATGDERRAVWLSDLLDTRHIGWNSLNAEPEGADWAHANAVIPGTRPGTFVVSSRHQDLVFQVDPDTGEIDWMLGHAEDWEQPWRERFLALRAADRAPMHQHGPSFDPDGNLVLFDNGNEGTTPYAGPVGPFAVEESRIEAWRIDPDARTATRVWSWTHPDVRLFSGAMGNAAALPSGRVVACYCFLEGEGGVSNAVSGRGRRSIRVVEIDPAAPDPLFDVRITLPLDTFPEGVQAYRAVPTPTLYPADVGVELGPI